MNGSHLTSADLEQALAALIELMQGDSDHRLPVGDPEQVLDAIHMAINLTAEELARQRTSELEAPSASLRAERELRRAYDELTISQHELEEKNVELHRAIARATEATAEAEVASAAKGTFLAMVSHELRTPLNRIAGAVDLLCESSLTMDQRNLVDVVRDASRDLLRQVTAILEIASHDQDCAQGVQMPFDPRRLVRDTVGGFHATARDKNVRLSWEVVDSVPSRLTGDPGRVTRAVSELVENAVKFTDPGSVCVRATATMGLQPRLVVRVTDTGPGIDPCTLHGLLEPFAQGDGSTTRAKGGSGLGLAIVSRLLQPIGGSIEVETEIGSGSTFVVVIPVTCAATERVVDTDALLERLGGDGESLIDVLDLVLQSVPDEWQQLAVAARAGDAKSVRLHAHTLKGAAGSISAEPLRLIAHRVEQWAADGIVCGAHSLLRELEVEIEKCCKEVEQVCRHAC